MKTILILGGTMFVGRELTDRLKANPAYDITLFNRGKSNAGLFSEVKQLHGDRETDDIKQILHTNWDVIIDFSGYYPKSFEKLLNDLKGKVKRYIFVSTVSVFDFEKAGEGMITEGSPVLACTEEQMVSKLPYAYGEKKAEMERMLLSQDWLQPVIFRPSYISGKYDWTERFYYWVYRAKQGGRILFPSTKQYNTSITLGADLASAVAFAIDNDVADKVYNSISFTQHTLHHFIKTAAEILGSNTEVLGLSDEQLKKFELKTSDFPLFVLGDLAISDSAFKRDFKFTPKGYRKDLEEIIDAAEKAGWPEPKPGLRWEREQQIINQL